MTPEAVAARQQATQDAIRKREADYMRGVSAQIAAAPQNKDAILEHHAQVAPKLGINPEHLTWLASDLSTAKTPEELVTMADYHSLVPEEQGKRRLAEAQAKATAIAKAEEARKLQEQRASDREDLVRLTAGLRPAPQEKLVSVLDANGNPTLIPQSQAAGHTPFSPAAQKQIQARPGTETSVQEALNQAAKVYEHPGKRSGTGWTSFMQSVPETNAKAFGANLNTFKAQGFLSAVNAMRGLGALTEKEGDKLVSSIGALDSSQSTKDFDDGLKAATKFLYEKAKASGLNVTLPAFAGSQSADNVDALLNKYK